MCDILRTAAFLVAISVESSVGGSLEVFHTFERTALIAVCFLYLSFLEVVNNANAILSTN